MSIAVSRTCTAPLDRLKIHLQTCTQPPPPNQPWTHYPRWASRSLAHAVRALHLHGGLPAFWRGNLLNCLKIVPESGTKFMVFEQFKKDGNVFLAGAIAGVCSQALVYPLETVKTQWMSLQPNTRLSTLRTLPLRYFFRGFLVSMVGSVPYTGLDLGVFDFLKTQHYTRTGSTPASTDTLRFGIISGCIATTLVYPLSLVRTRLQAQGTRAHPRVYSGFWHVVIETYQRESILGFYKGWIPTLMKVVPATGISYMCYENMKQFFF